MRVLLTAMIISGLAACASPQPVSYYQLSAPMPVRVESANTSARSQLLQIQPVKVANYLNGAGLVMQSSEVELVIASRHLWADALDQQLYRLLTEQLQATGYNLTPTGLTDATRLQLTIDRFHAQENGVAIISGYYSISSGSERVTRTFTYQQPLTADGYPALASALSSGWQQLVRDIITELTKTAE